MRYPILPVGGFIAAFLVLVPAFWHWRSRNIPTLSLIAWLFTLNLIHGANSLIWSDNIWDKVPMWCDISAKLIMGASIALPACTLCICKYLVMVGGNKTVGLDQKGRIGIVAFDFGFCWGIPILFMALHYIVQDHRYDIVQYIGCQPTTYVSIPGLIIVWLPPLLLSAGTLVYAGIALFHFVQMRVVFSSVLQVSDSPMSTDRYLRLIAMSVTLVLWCTTMTALSIGRNIHSGLKPWVSLEDVHSNWDRADAYVWSLMSPRSRTFALLFWWTVPVSSIIFFVFLGFGEDASKKYRRVGKAILDLIPSRGSQKDETFTKTKRILLLSSSSLIPGVPKHVSPRPSNSSYDTSSTTTYVTEKDSKLRELVLPLPVLAKPKNPAKSGVISTVSVSNTLNSLKPLRPTTRSRMADSSFFFHPTTSNSVTNHSEITRFSMSDEHLAFGQVDGASMPLSANGSVMNQAFQELPPIQSLRSLNSMMGFSQSRSKPPACVESKERRWSERSKKLRPPPLRLDNGEGRLRECVSRARTVIVAEPREVLVRGSVQVTVQGQ